MAVDTMNSILVIHPYKHQSVWVIDDPQVGLDKSFCRRRGRDSGPRGRENSGRRVGRDDFLFRATVSR
jgi:hypothetical protein